MSILKPGHERHLDDLTPQQRAQIEAELQDVFMQRDLCPDCAASLLVDLAERIQKSWTAFQGTDHWRGGLH